MITGEQLVFSFEEKRFFRKVCKMPGCLWRFSYSEDTRFLVGSDFWNSDYVEICH